MEFILSNKFFWVSRNSAKLNLCFNYGVNPFFTYIYIREYHYISQSVTLQ